MGLNRCVGVRAERGSVHDHARTATRRLSNARDRTRLRVSIAAFPIGETDGDAARAKGMTPRYLDAPSPSPSRRHTEGSRGQIRRDAMCLGESTSSSPLRRSRCATKENQWLQSNQTTSATCIFAEGTDETEAAARRPTGASDATDRAAHASRSLPGWTCSGLVDNARRRVRRAETRPPFPSRGHGVSRGCGHLARAAAAARQRGAYASSPPVDPDQPFLCARVLRRDEHARSRLVASALPRPGHARGYAIAQGDAGLGRVSRQLFFFRRVP